MNLALFEVLKRTTLGAVISQAMMRNGLQLIFVNSGNTNIEVSHFFRGWRLKYDNIYRPTLNILLGINHFQKLIQHRYEHALQHFNDRVDLLRILVNRKKPGIDSSISFEDVLTEIYGPRFHKSIGDTHFEHYDHLRFLLLSLQESGDIQCDASKYFVKKIVLLPQALKTFRTLRLKIQDTRIH